MFELYVLDTCPYCKKVISYMDENGIRYRIHNISSESEKSELIKIGGKDQVPYLFDSKSNYGLYESEDIIEYLKSV